MWERSRKAGQGRGWEPGPQEMQSSVVRTKENAAASGSLSPPQAGLAVPELQPKRLLWMYLSLAYTGCVA